MKLRWGYGVGVLLVMLALAGCNLASNEPEPSEPTIGTPVAQASETAAANQTSTPSPSPLPSVTAAPTLTPRASRSSQELPSRTPLPSLTPTDGPPASPTTAPTLTNTPFGIITLTPAPTFTRTSAPVATAFYPQPATFTPVFVPQTPASPTATQSSAQVCPTCDNLRLREGPGTAGNIVTMLDANTSLTIIGRTANNGWVQVRLGDGRTGWVAAEYLVTSVDLNTVAITGTQVDLPTAAPVTGPEGLDVVSGISAHARQIFLDGRSKGNSAHTFTRVGDSITAAPQFLTPIASGTYNLGEYGYLSGAIGFFGGPNGRGLNPFGATSIAAGNGWGTTSALDINNAPSGTCNPGETPVACEYRLVKPSVALIMFGTNDSGGLPTADFRANLQRIVQISIDMGVIPVLSTIPPKHYDPAVDGRVTEFNQVIIATARAYDIPLWNYWDAMSGLPAEGLSADGVHPSTPPDGITTVFDSDHLQYGYTMRNLTALQMLYTLWQQVLYDGDQAPAQPAPTSNQTDSQTTTDQVDLNTYSCPGAPAPRLSVGQKGRVTPGLPNKIRSEPATSAPQVGAIPGEGVFTVIGGPRCADGYTWWQVSYTGIIGWTANGSSQEYWVEPY
ncbi:MAG: SH3 domain-containing protein [Anaerolineae bacterium]|nr:SH3 domain-containing protein [Anaerolineae bacterium]